MKRNLFLKRALSLTVLSTLINGISLKAFGEKSLFHSLLTQSKQVGRILVLIQLDGGNDGLNTVIPLDQYANLTKARKNIMIPERKVLPLHHTPHTGLHPAMRGIQTLYNNKQATIIQGVGYPNPDLSHFRSIDIWNTGSDSATELHTGWVGRFLEQESQSYPEGKMPDPPAIQLSSNSSNILQGSALNLGMVVTSSHDFYDIVLGEGDSPADTRAGNELAFFRNEASTSKEYLIKVRDAAQAQKNLSSRYPPSGSNALADQLKIAAQLIGGGLQTQVYVVNLKGFDTHDLQVDSADPTQGLHADLLSQLSVAIAAFEDDLQLMGKADQVLGMTFSEFGRRIKSNASYGCDHGTSAPMLLFGSKLKGGLVGKNPEIADKVEVNDNLAVQYDFHSVYASVLKGWLGLSNEVVDATVLANYPTLDLFEA